MADQRSGGISWTEETWNPIRGCSRVSAGCRNCYAERIAATRLSAPGKPYHGLAVMKGDDPTWTGTIAFAKERLEDPLRWTRPRRIFVNSMSDLFHESLPDDVIDLIFAVMASAPRHTFQVLTKRAARMREYLSAPGRMGAIAGAAQDLTVRRPLVRADDWWPLPNVWLGVSVEDQANANARIPELLASPAEIRWLSCEPLVGPVDFKDVPGFNRVGLDLSSLWVVAGGESGPGARPTHPDWVRRLRDQCSIAGVPFHFKQWGDWFPVVTNEAVWEHPPESIAPAGEVCCVELDGEIPVGVGKPFTRNAEPSACWMVRTGKKTAGRLLDGRIWDEYPSPPATSLEPPPVDAGEASEAPRASTRRSAG